MSGLDPCVRARLVAAVDGAVIEEPQAQAKYLREWRDRYVGASPMIVRPRTTEEVSAVMRIADGSGLRVIPQGGNTGVVGAQIPERGDEIVVSLERMARVRGVDVEGAALTAEAGVTLADAQSAADAAGLLFPLSLASEGTAQVGGVLSTNAGGTAVLAYGNARDLALGLEVVLPDGRVWNGLSGLRKDNTGYDLKHLYIGGEGTLGLITAATLKLFAKPKAQETVLFGLERVEDAIALLTIARDEAGLELTTFELMPRLGVAFACRHAGGRDPLENAYPWYVLMRLTSPRRGADLSSVTEAIFSRAVVGDAATARSETQARALLHLRESLSEAQKPEGGSIKHDVSVPIRAVPDFLREAGRTVEALVPGARPVPFGHLGDGNLHYNVSQPLDMDKAAFLAETEAVNEAVHAVVVRHGGSISAEHGIGRLKRDLLPGFKGPVAMDVMYRIKRALDPKSLMNPGKMLVPNGPTEGDGDDVGQ